VTRRIEYSLDSSKRVGERDPLRLRRCQACQLLFDPSEPCCPECGWKPEPVVERDRLAIHGVGNLVEFDDADFAYRAEFWRLIQSRMPEPRRSRAATAMCVHRATIGVVP